MTRPYYAGRRGVNALPHSKKNARTTKGTKITKSFPSGEPQTVAKTGAQRRKTPSCPSCPSWFNVVFLFPRLRHGAIVVEQLLAAGAVACRGIGAVGEEIESIPTVGEDGARQHQRRLAHMRARLGDAVGQQLE